MNKKTHIPEEVLKKLLTGKLDNKQQAEWEAFFSENPFEKEAIEGLQMLSAEELNNDLQDLKQKVNPSNQTKIFSYRAIAASVAILLSCIVLALYFTKSSNLDQSLSLKKNTHEENQIQQKNAETAEENAGSVQNYYSRRTETTQTKELKSEKQRAEMQNPSTREDKALSLKETESEKQTNLVILDNKREEIRGVEKSEATPTEENNQAGLAPKKSEIESIRKDDQAEQSLERKQASSAYSNADDSRKKIKKYSSTPQDNRALNFSKEENYLASTIYLQGQIFDKKSKKALKDVKISIEGYNLSTQTDSLGKFLLNLPVSEKYTLKLELLGYESLNTQAKPNTQNIFYLKKK